MSFRNRAKLIALTKMLEALAPELEIKMIQKLKLEEKIWFAILIREKKEK